jgi:glycogen debranching enzyme
MTYHLTKLAPGSYDVWLNGVIVASLVRNGSTSDAPWTAELLKEFGPGEMPEPFTAPEHTFASLEEARVWLGGPVLGPGMRSEGQRA